MWNNYKFQTLKISEIWEGYEHLNVGGSIWNVSSTHFFFIVICLIFELRISVQISIQQFSYLFWVRYYSFFIFWYWYWYNEPEWGLLILGIGWMIDAKQINEWINTSTPPYTFMACTERAYFWISNHQACSMFCSDCVISALFDDDGVPKLLHIMFVLTTRHLNKCRKYLFEVSVKCRIYSLALWLGSGILTG